MLTTETRVRVKSIINRLQNSQSVSLEERIYLNKLARVSTQVSTWLNEALSQEARAIDDDIS